MGSHSKYTVKRCVFGLLDFGGHLYICFPAFFFLFVNLEGLGVFPLDAVRNSKRFGATNASRALTAVDFRLSNVFLQLVQIKYLLPSTKY